MKTLRKIGLSFMAVTMLLSISSCSKDDDDPIDPAPVSGPTIEDYLNMPTDVKLPAAENQPVKITMEEAGSGFAGFTLIEKDLMAIVELERAETRAAVAGKYFLRVPFKRVNSTTVTIDVPDMGEVTLTFQNKTSVTLLRQLRQYKATIQSIPEATNITEENLNRTWHTIEYRAIIMFDRVPAYNKAMSSIVDMQEDINKVFKPSQPFTMIKDELLMTGFCGIYGDKGYNWTILGEKYWTNIETYECSYSFVDREKGKMKLTIDGHTYDTDVRFEYKDHQNFLYLIMEQDFKALGTTGVHNISGKLIIKMTD